jgi:hypothetical protein
MQDNEGNISEHFLSLGSLPCMIPIVTNKKSTDSIASTLSNRVFFLRFITNLRNMILNSLLPMTRILHI